MDWRYNTIWLEQLEENKIFQKDFKKNLIESNNKSFENAEYAMIWHLKEGIKPFNNLPENHSLSYLELNWANIKNFDGIDKFKNLKRLELYYCTKLENDIGLSRLKDSLEFLHMNTSKKFKFTNELLQLKKLRVLSLNTCGPIDNLGFLENFPNLIDFRFVDTNILDGNLKPLIEHPTIRTVGFLNKKHYNFKDDKLEIELHKKFDSQYKTMVYKGQYSTFRYDYE